MLFWIRQCVLRLLPGILIAAALVTPDLVSERAVTSGWLGSLPLILFAIALVFGVLFNQFRLALLVPPYLAVTWLQTAHPSEAVHANVLASVLLPCWVATVVPRRERRAFSPLGLAMLCISFALGGLLLRAGTPPFKPIVKWLAPHAPLLPAISFAVATVTLLVSRQRRTGLLVVQSLLFLMLVLHADQPLFARFNPVWFTFCATCGAATLLVWAELDASWQHAFMDELTRLPSRRPLMQHLSSLVGTCTVAIVDVDHFKRVNDRHGHDTGDQVLRMVAARLQRFRKGQAYRYGGEEFVIVMGRGRLAQHVEALDALRDSIATRPFVVRGTARPKRKPTAKKKKKDVSIGGKRIKISVSIGVATRSRSRQKAEDVLRQADKALYRAKRTGRNRVCCADK